MKLEWCVRWSWTPTSEHAAAPEAVFYPFHVVFIACWMKSLLRRNPMDHWVITLSHAHDHGRHD
jgi:hypothetical protein